MCLQPSTSPEYDIVELIDNSMICDANDDLGYVDNMFSVLGGSFDNYMSLGYFSGYDPCIHPYCVCLGNLPTKIMWTTLFNHSYDFSMAIDKFKGIRILFGMILVIDFYLLFSKL